jgi:Tfp pilus assembly protein PilZ
MSKTNISGVSDSFDASNRDVAEQHRKSQRKSIAIPCVLRLRDQVFAARLLDLSRGGAFVQTEESLAIGTELLIIFKAPGRDGVIHLSLKAKAAHVGRFVQGFQNFNGFGASFMYLSQKDSAKLEEILEMCESSPERKFEFM